MNALARIPTRIVVLGAVLALLAVGLMVLRGEHGTVKVTAHFSRAVSVYPGTEVRILGVPVGQVTAVVPDGDSVRVDMTYDASYKVPADAKAVIITPTLVADRFVQLTPVYRSGPVMKSGADIALPDTGTPVELDRIYQSLAMLSEALGPNGANHDGSLDGLLAAGANALGGEGATANKAILNMSAAVDTFANHSGDLFATVQNLDQLTQTFAASDKTVNKFLRHLTRASKQLAGERGNLDAALRALAGAVGTVRTFVHDNRGAISGEVKDLTSVLDVLVKEKASLTTAVEKGPLGAENLALAFDMKSGSIGSRVQWSANAEGLDGFLCAVVQDAKIPSADLACKVFKQLINPLHLGQAFTGASSGQPGLLSLPGAPSVGAPPASSLDQLLGGGR